MRVGFIGPLSPLRGGIVHYDDLFLDGLREAGHEVVAISFKQLYPKFLFPGTSEIDPNTKMADNVFPVLKAWNPFTWFKASKILKDFGVEKLVFIHWHPFFAVCMRFLTLIKPKNGTALFVHNALPHEKQWLGKLLNPLLFKSANKIWIGSKIEAKYLDILSPQTEYEVILHPVHDRFSRRIEGLTKEEAKKKIGQDPNSILFSHLGLVREYKGVDVLLEAFSKIKSKNAVLEVVGEFYDDKKKYDDIVENLNLDKNVKLTNKYITDDDMALHLRAADAVVLPYRNATQSGVAMIALACGTPVIASRVGMLAEVLEPGVYGDLVEPEDSDDLAGTIDRFIKNNTMDYKTRAEKIIKKMVDQFGDWKRYTNRIVEE